jgi:hypothetical protein
VTKRLARLRAWNFLPSSKLPCDRGWGELSVDIDIVDCEARAREALQLAQNQTDPEVKAHLLQVAQHWLQLRRYFRQASES